MHPFCHNGAYIHVPAVYDTAPIQYGANLPAAQIYLPLLQERRALFRRQEQRKVLMTRY